MKPAMFTCDPCFLSSLVCVFSLSLLAPTTALASEDKTSPAKPMAALLEVEEVENIDYYKGDDADQKKHKLDLYLPKGMKEYPVLFFVHGGGWRSGDKNYFGVYSSIAKFFARRGIGTVVINYRLSPSVAHPEHIKDVARAFAWTYRNIEKYGGRSDRIFLCGHSAGGHLVALLATDESYLKREGLGIDHIRGVIPMSGVYYIPENFLNSVFGKGPKMKKQASPAEHVKPGLPPFLILFADKDFPGCGRPTSEAFCKALKETKCQAETREIKNSNHFKIIMSAAIENDPVTEAILGFITSKTK